MHVEIKINKYIIENIKYFIEHEYDILLVITYGKKVKVLDLVESSELDGIRIIVRNNFGKDFGSFKDALERISTELNGINTLILQNDSLIGPLYKSDFIDKVERFPYDVVGITESLDYKYHLQSSFILLKSQKAINLLKVFMKDYIVYQYRPFIVHHGEIALSQFFINNSINLGAYAPLLELLNCNNGKRIFNNKSNPQHIFMDDLFLFFNYPYLKRDAFKNNPNQFSYDYKNILDKMSKESKENLLEALCER